MPSTHRIHLEITPEMIKTAAITTRHLLGLPGPGEWNPAKARARHHGTGPYNARMEYWMFRATGSEQFFKDCFKVEVHTDTVVIWYYLTNRQGKRYIDPHNREEAAQSALVISGAEIPDWMRL